MCKICEEKLSKVNAARFALYRAELTAKLLTAGAVAVYRADLEGNTEDRIREHAASAIEETLRDCRATRAVVSEATGLPIHPGAPQVEAVARAAALAALFPE